MLKVAPSVAVTYLQDSGRMLKASATKAFKFAVRECEFCGNSKWKVVFYSRAQIMRHYCCEGRTQTFLEVVRREQGFDTDWQALKWLINFDKAPLYVPRSFSPEFSTTQLLLDEWKRTRPVEGLEGDMITGCNLLYYCCDWERSEARKILRYARKRNVPLSFLKTNRCGYFTRGPMAGRLVFLTMEVRSCVYYVARSIDKAMPKYLCPEPDLVGGRSSSDVVFDLDRVRERIPVITEGVLSALSVEDNQFKGVAVYGKVLSERQARLISWTSKVAVLLREADVPRKVAADNARRLLNVGVQPVLADLIQGDPNDNPEQLPEVMQQALFADDAELMRQMLR